MNHHNHLSLERTSPANSTKGDREGVLGEGELATDPTNGAVPAAWSRSAVLGPQTSVTLREDSDDALQLLLLEVEGWVDEG